MPEAHLEEEWTRLDDLVALHTAQNAPELHRRLLCSADGGANKADAFEPWGLFHKVHADEPEGAVVTAMLLLTDRRWRNATGRLVERIEESGLVPHEQLDILAQTFLAGGPQIYWQVPGNWFTGPAIVVGASASGAADGADPEGGPDSDSGPVVFAREIRPPLRRWAAGRAVRSDSGCWGALVQRARQVDPRGGAAIIQGLLDCTELLPPAAREVVVDVAATWPNRRLRERASTLRHPPEPACAGQPPKPASAEGLAAPTIERAPAPPSLQPSLF